MSEYNNNILDELLEMYHNREICDTAEKRELVRRFMVSYNKWFIDGRNKEGRLEE